MVVLQHRVLRFQFAERVGRRDTLDRGQLPEAEPKIRFVSYAVIVDGDLASNGSWRHIRNLHALDGVVYRLIVLAAGNHDYANFKPDGDEETSSPFGVRGLPVV